MRAAYISYVPKSVPGIEKGISGRARACAQAGFKFDFFILCDSPFKKQGNVNIIPLKYLFPDFLNGKINEFEKKVFRLGLIKRSLAFKKGNQPIYNEYDRIIFRYPSSVGPAFAAAGFASGMKGKLFTEHHCFYQQEFKCLEQGFKPDLKIHLENKNSPFFFNNVSGIVGVTNEITNQLKGTTGIGRAITISNGIDSDRVKFTGFKPFNGKELTILLLASNFATWHGFDRLFKGLDKYSGKVKIKIIAAGRFEQSWFKTNNPNINIENTGMVTGEKLNSIFMDSNIALASLAIHRAGLSEASVLKAREYAARGMPFIYAGSDLDFDGNSDFCMNVDLSDEALNIDSIMEFAKRTSRFGSDLSFEMRKWAEKNLNWNTRMSKLNSFLINPEAING